MSKASGKKPIDEEALKEYFFNRKDKPYTLDELFEDYNVWFHLPDRDYFDVVLACCLDRRIKPDVKIWIYVVANSGNFKSEFYHALNGFGHVYGLDSLTPYTLISGKVVKKKGKTVPVVGLLPKIDGKILMIKDFATILTMHQERRRMIFGQLRALYDEKLEYGFGQFSDKIVVKAKVGIIIFTTPYIDRFTSLEAQLGSRFLSIRHKPFNEEDARKRKEKIDKNRNLREIRTQIAWLTSWFLGELNAEYELELSDYWKNRIYDLANYVAYMRAQIDMAWKWGHPTDSIGEVQREETTRIYLQMLKLAKCLCYLGQKKEFSEEEWNTLVRVGEDSISPAIRNRILKLYVRDNYQYRETRYRELKISRQYYIDKLRILEGCQILDEKYDLTPKAKKLMKRVYENPKLLQAIANQPIQPQIVEKEVVQVA